MKHVSLRFAFALFAAFAFTSAWAQSPSERAGQVLDQLDAGQFDEVAATFDPQMAAQIDAASLGQVWASIPAQFGALQSRGEPVEVQQGELQVVVIPLQHEQALLNATIAFDPDGQIAGLLVQPAQPAAAPAAEPAPAGADEP